MLGKLAVPLIDGSALDVDANLPIASKESLIEAPFAYLRQRAGTGRRHDRVAKAPEIPNKVIVRANAVG
jgi:hypothetical protein